MSALVVYETMFGNTRSIAEAIAHGLREVGQVTVTDVATAPRRLDPDLTLLAVGAPTHAFSMSRPATRRSAVTAGAHPLDVGQGIREWLDRVNPGPGRPVVVTFDTRVNVPLLPGSAARAAARALRRLDLTVLDSRTFWVTAQEGPLRDGEIERATAWGRELAASRMRR